MESRSRRSGGRAELAEERFAVGGAAEALANGVALRTSGLLARWQERLADYPDALVEERVEEAAERWGGFTPERAADGRPA